MTRLSLSAGASAAAILLAGAGAARASVTVIGGGLAEACSKAAMAGLSDYRYERTCTDSLENETLAPRDRAGTYVNRGIMKLRRMDWGGALADFDTAAKLKPTLGEIYVNRGAAYVGEHRYADGLKDLNKSLELGVEEPAKAYYNRALAYEGLDDMKSAYFDYQKAVEIDPTWDAPKQELTRFHVSRRD